MNISDLGEKAFIDRIRKGCVVRPEHVIKAIGDDSAVFSTPSGLLTLVTTDLLIERVHFIRSAISGFQLGYKACAVNLSDIAAMGGEPREVFVSLAIPPDCTVEYCDELYRGMKSLLKEYDVNILGGDTTKSNLDLVINITVVGAVSKEKVLMRSGAGVGDLLCSTGYLGDSRAGLHILLHNLPIESDVYTILYNAHILPIPCIAQGKLLASSGAVHAAIDVSDGLSTDLGHITRESKVGARVFSEKIPRSPALKSFCDKEGLDPLTFALSGGEDYTLLCAVNPNSVPALCKDYQTRFSSPLHIIGEIIEGDSLELCFPDGTSKPMVPSGWDHFTEK